jgi:carbon-monoxide dehydrogenase small subunit
MTTPMKTDLTINGSTQTVEVEPRMTLLDALRDKVGLKGTHAGCEHGVCGACTVIVDGEAVRSCLMFAVQCDGMEITTIEGAALQAGEMDIVQDSFCETHGLQCGYCTPGMVLAAKSLLSRVSDPTDEQIRDAISGNLCRCTGYLQIVEAIRLAGKRIRESNAVAMSEAGQ